MHASKGNLSRLRRGVKAFLEGFPKWFGLYLGMAGLITFNLFIMEEAFQTVMFGTWPAQDAKEWRLVKRALGTMETIRSATITMNYIAGWIHPFAFVAYGKYADSEREYIDGLRAKCFAHAPELFDGEVVTVTFHASEKEKENDRWILRNGNMRVIVKEDKPVITGRVSLQQGLIFITEER